MKRNIKSRLLTVLLAVAMLIGLMPAMGQTIHAEDDPPLTTITPTDDDTYSETVEGVVSVEAENVAYYTSGYGWIWSEGNGSLTITAAGGYTITKCVFRQNDKDPVPISTAPFAITFSDGSCTKNYNMNGVTSIEVYGTAPDPISVNVDVGEGHASLFTNDVLNYIKDEYELDDVTISGNVITLIGVNPDKTENQLNYLIWGVLNYLTEDTHGIHNGERFYDVGYKPFDEYTSYDDFDDDVYDEQAHEAKVSDGLTFYVLWKTPLDAIELTNAVPVCGDKSEDVLPSMDGLYFPETEGLWKDKNEEMVETFEGGKEYKFSGLLYLDPEGSLWRNFIPEDFTLTIEGVDDEDVSYKIWEGNSISLSYKVTAEHVWSEWTITLPTETKDGELTRECKGCGEKETIVLYHDEVYSCIKGSGLNWTKGSSSTADFKFESTKDDDNTFAKFTGIEIDGDIVDKDNYTATKGSVNISLKPSYLESLSVGTHTLTVNFLDGSVDTKFTIVKKSSDTTPAYVAPKTGIE